MDAKVGNEISALVQELQPLVDAMLAVESMAQYVREGKLSLLDSRYEPVDAMIRAGLLKVV